MNYYTKSGVLEERRRRIQAYLNKSYGESSTAMQMEYAYFRANLSNLAPHVLPMADWPLFTRLQANRMLGNLDMEHPDIIRTHGWENGCAPQILDQPGVICTFHTGSFRYLNLLLALAGRAVSILVSGDSLPAEQFAYLRRFVPGAQRLGVDPDIAFIDAEHPASLLRMARAAKQGRYLLAYVDGSTGAGNAKPANLISIPFGAKRIGVRKGVAVLAHRLGLPVYPVYSRRAFPQMEPEDSHHLRYDCPGALVPAVGEPVETFAARVLTALYRSLEEIALATPQDWSGWLHVHTAIQQSSSPPGNYVPAPFIPFQKRGKAFALHQRTYCIYRVPWGIYMEFCKKQESLLPLTCL